MKKLLQALIATALVVSISLFSTGCKKDDGSTGPTPSGGVGYGSGTISSTSTTQGNLSFTGQGVFPIGAGPSVIAIFDTVGDGLQVIGYQQISGSNYNLIVLQFGTQGSVSAQTYTMSGNNSYVLIGANVDTLQTIESLAFVPISGSITVTSVSGTNVVGSFSITAIRQSDNTTAQFTGNFNVTYARGRAIFGGGDGDVGAAAWSQHWSTGEFVVQLEYNDPSQTVTSVTVTGPGLTHARALGYAGNGSWNSWTSPNSPVSFGNTYPAGLPFTYTFSITSATGTTTATSTVYCFQSQFASNLSPTGMASGTPTFSWTGINDSKALYQVQLSNNSSRIWNSQDVSGTSVVYSGTALTPGTTYFYSVVVTNSSACNEESFAQGSFIYQ